jgi:hypothetical protein
MSTDSDTDSSIELDHLIDKIKHLRIPNHIMAPNNESTFNLQLIKLHVDTVPQYDGNLTTLEIFISSCDHLFNTFGTDPTIASYLLRVVIGKLTGRAQALVATKTELNSWPLIKRTLRSCFGDQRNIDCLEQDLIFLRPFKNESPLNFGQRIQTVRSQLSAKVNSLSVLEMSDATKTIYLKQYDNMALKTFIRGLTGTLQSIIRLRDPKSLETAMNLVVEEQNFQYTQHPPSQINRLTPQIQMHERKPPQPSFNNTPHFTPTNISLPYHMHNNQTPQRPSHNQNQQFNRPPIRETPMYQYPKQLLYGYEPSYAPGQSTHARSTHGRRSQPTPDTRQDGRHGERVVIDLYLH